LVFTVDMAAPGVRYRAFHSGLAGASGMRGQIWRAMQGMMHPRWAWDVGVRGRPHSLGNIGPQLGRQSGIDDFFRWIRENFDSSIGWKDLEEVREVWKGPLVLKGILDVEDARQAADLGADGIVVSNHGGRQLDGVPSTARALPAIADAVGDRLSVLADGGVRSGLDVVRMIALGAKAVMLGRAWAYALGAGGEAYVRRLIGQFESEIRSAMILTGTQSVTEIDRSRLVMQPQGRNQPW
ncbi:MAG: alpha-hydroxy-acid oxidizing protein, partial [Sphingobium sp.]